MSPLLLIFLSVASAQVTWIGAGGSITGALSGDFSTASNWLAGLAPGATSDILITTVGSYTVEITQDYTTTGTLSIFSTLPTDVIQIHVHDGVTAVFGSLDIRKGIVTVDDNALFHVTGGVSADIDSAIEFAGTGQVLIEGDMDVAAGLAAAADQTIDFTCDLLLNSQLSIDDNCRVTAAGGGDCDNVNGGISFLSDNANFVVKGAFDLADCIPDSATGVTGTLTFDPDVATSYSLSSAAAATNYACNLEVMGDATVETAAQTTIEGAVHTAADSVLVINHETNIAGDADIDGELDMSASAAADGDFTFASTSRLTMRIAAALTPPQVSASGTVHFDGDLHVVQLGGFRIEGDVEVVIALYADYTGAFASVDGSVAASSSNKGFALLKLDNGMVLQSGGWGVRYDPDSAVVYNNAATGLVPSFMALLVLVWASLRMA